MCDLMKLSTQSLAFSLSLATLIAGLGGCAVSVDADDDLDLASEESELVSATSVNGTFVYGTWTGDYGTRVMASTGVLTNSGASYATTGTFTCSGTTACPGGTGTWVYGQDGTRSRWADFTADGVVTRWKLSETSTSVPLFVRSLGSKLNKYGQRVPYGDLFLKSL